MAYPICLLLSAAFLGWAHTHTDEIPVVLGLMALVSATMGAAFPGRWIFTWLCLGPVLFGAEFLVHAGVLHAPYRADGVPWPALFGYLPAGAGAGIGRVVRPSKCYSL